MTSLARRNAALLGPAGAGEGTDAAEVVGPSHPATSACINCGAPAEPGDDLCRAHGGFEDGIARHEAMRAA